MTDIVYIPLSRREKQVLYFAARGALDKEIADIIGLTYETIRTYRKNIYKKLLVNNMPHAVFVCMRIPAMRDYMTTETIFGE